jgi:DNA-binding transcriptional ArsR family regulator
MFSGRALDLTKEVVSAVERRDWPSVKADLSVLCEQVVEALVERRDADVSQIYDAVERAYSALATRSNVESTVDSQLAAGELRALTRLLAVATQYQKPVPSVEVALENGNRLILEQLQMHAEGLSGRELAEALDFRPETIARKLPVLRDAGLVKTQQVGKANVNRITDVARECLAAAKERPADKQVVLARKVVTPPPQQGRRPKPQRLSVLTTQSLDMAKPFADGILREAGKQLADMNDKLAALIKGRKGNPIEGLTIHFSPRKSSVVGSIDYAAKPRAGSAE